MPPLGRRLAGARRTSEAPAHGEADAENPCRRRTRRPILPVRSPGSAGTGGGRTGWGRVNKVDLIDVVYRTHGGMSRQEAGELIDTIFRCVKSILGNERRMQVSGLGSFQVVQRAARVGRNPHTGEPLDLPGRRTLIFRAAPSLIDRLNEPARLGPRSRASRRG